MYEVSFAQLKSKVDERFELVSIVFGLAEAPEYSDNQIRRYKSSIDNYFSEHKNHELIDYAKKIRETQGISYDAVVKVASFLDIKNYCCPRKIIILKK